MAGMVSKTKSRIFGKLFLDRVEVDMVSMTWESLLVSRMEDSPRSLRNSRRVMIFAFMLKSNDVPYDHQNNAKRNGQQVNACENCDPFRNIF